MDKKIAQWSKEALQDARDLFDEEVAECLCNNGYLLPLPAELALAEKPYTGKNLHKFEQYSAQN